MKMSTETYVAPTAVVEGAVRLGKGCSVWHGAVIRGETSHYDVVVNASTGGIANIAAEGKLPVILGILTTDTVDQAMNRAGLKAGNLGSSWASTAVEMANLYKTI